MTTHQDGYIRWLRSHIGHELIYLVYAVAFVFDERGYLLVQERYDFDWLSVPGGAMEPHESIRDCVLRETYEETGIHCAIEHFIGAFSHPDFNLTYPNGDQVQPWTAAFVCRATSEAIQVDGKEALQAAFRPVEKIFERLPRQYQQMLTSYREGIGFEPVYYNHPLKPYYPILRAKVGAERIILPGGTAVIFNEAGEVLTVRDKGRRLWDLPAGLADLGESTTGTVVREIREETGLLIEPVRTLGLYTRPSFAHMEFSNGDKAHLVDLILECRIVDDRARHVDNDEIDGIQFMSLEALAAQAGLSAMRRQIIADLQHRQQAPFVR